MFEKGRGAGHRTQPHLRRNDGADAAGTRRCVQGALRLLPGLAARTQGSTSREALAIARHPSL
ncbi:MAG: hypothetical protein JWR15_3780 [Prosthecobacter sp.]|nr:hypothetical protein [Prosthecobacter sp.]